MAGDVAIAQPRPFELPTRVAITAGAVALLLAGQRVRLPGVDEETFRSWSEGGWQLLSCVALGTVPFVAGYLVVELVALAVPRLRPLRHGGAAGRRPLARAAWAVALALSAWYGWALAVTLQGELLTARGDPALEAGLAPALGIAAVVALGTIALGGLAALVSRHGLGNGFAVLIAVEHGQLLVRVARHGTGLPRPLFSDASLLFALAVAVIVPLVAGQVRRTAREEAQAPRVPVPTCGLVPLTGADAAFAFPARLAEWFAPAAPLAAALAAASWVTSIAAFALSVALAAAFAALFAPPGAVAAAYRRALGEGLDDAGAAEVRRAARRANRRSVALVAGLALVPIVVALLGSPVDVGTGLVLAIAVVSAVALDLDDELRARAAGLRAPAWALHRVYAARPALHALAAAGIPAAARCARFRALFQLFAPYAPVEVLVAPPHVAEAEAICARVAGDPGR